MFSRKKRKEKGGKKTFTDRYNTFCYRILGKRLENEKKHTGLAEKLGQANMGITPGLYLARNIITAVLVAIVSAIFYSILFVVVFHSEIWYILVPALTLVCAICAFLILPFAVMTRRSKRGASIEKELPYTLSELAIMASTGLSPVEIFRRIAKRNEREAISAEFKKIVYKMDIEGKDLISAISEAARESPSLGFRETLWDLANMVHQGGNLDEYLRNKADDVMRMKRENQKQFIEKLGTYSDLYITLVLIGILFISIGAFLMNAMRTSIGGLSSDILLIGVTWGMIPLSVLIFSILISSAYSQVE
ncbi:MAG: type II secretion system F family protein [Methanomassiliicoccales archaeon]|jgi:archaellum biogenesis protein FlaJ (TadC family)